MDLGISGKIALVTGADSGIGFQTARKLLIEGVQVAITDRAGESLDEACDKLSEFGGVIAVPADLTKADDVSHLVAEVTRKLGAPDILVNCAGITGETGDFLDISDDDWDTVLQINLMGAVRTARAVIPAMREKGWGRVVLIGSEDGAQPYVEDLPYCAAKAGIINLAKGLSKAYGPDGVLVNTVSPAFIETPMTDKMMKARAEERNESFDEAIKSFLAENRSGMALGRRGKPEEVAAMIVFLCSEQASFINGSNMRVDSGSVMAV